MEVPEIEEGIVEIKAVAREPGHRSKIAVSSREPAVDPVGACVGPKGSRVRNVVTELRGEKIDVVPWSAGPWRRSSRTRSSRRRSRRPVSTPRRRPALVIVPDYQLSLAIGKEGQNARLAARLDGVPGRHQERDAADGGRSSPDGRGGSRRDCTQARGRRSRQPPAEPPAAEAEPTAEPIPEPAVEAEEPAEGLSDGRAAAAPERTCVGCRREAGRAGAAPAASVRRTAWSAVDAQERRPAGAAYVHRERSVRAGGARARGARQGVADRPGAGGSR